MTRQIDAATVVGALRAVATEHGYVPAILDGAESLDHAMFWQQAGQVARRLRARGVRNGDVVALAADRTAGLLVGLVGVLRSGATVLPLDVTYPRPRLMMMLQDSGARIVVGHEHTVGPFTVEGREAVILAEVVATEPVPAEDELPEPHPGDGCYLLYTSGSTGGPKAVLMPHAGLANLVRWQARTSGVGPGSRTLQYGAISFDVALQEIFSTLATGGTLVCIDEEARRNPVRTWELMIATGVERIFLPYVGLQALVMVADDIPVERSALREIIPGGEQLQCTRALRELLLRMSQCRISNHYGPVETHAVTCHPLEADPERWLSLPPIGKPIPGNRVHVLDEAGRETNVGEIGELYVAGDQVSYGYWRRPDLTAERFLPSPDGDGGRMYRTGDLARRRADGSLDFLGRADDQVKIRGFRVELAEVEAAVSDHPDVAACGATVAGDEGIDRILVAFVLPRPGFVADTVREDLRNRLPSHLVPEVFHVVDALPQLPSGKLDRRGLRLLAEREAAADPR
ncbi:amino acid adenylation domain-containing protein [Streptomyces soliscabiei]|uniref:amino acid adenylation domain-containing protein n=1 Tax=Streptomyces soliscabiei TaxID=588897 RepID=UPI0029A132C1|nr:amino acid adenylation domain-containing protein [Streptomyces sp. NY05-11A]MDX2680506.1 amino acid adenylation domain-containing protein [Streptomyces sp. NY05-11A]